MLACARRVLIVTLVLALVVPALALAENRGLIWKVEGRGCTVWVGGSIHFGTPEIYPLPEAYETAFKKSKIFAVEADITNMDEQEMAVMIQLAAYSPGEGLSKNLSAKTMRAYRDAGIDLAPYEPLRPWYAVMAVVQERLMKLGYRAELGIDMHLLQRAAQQGKKIKELEGVDYQFKLMDKLSGDADKFMEFALADLSKMDTQLGTLADAWKAGDAPAMAKAVFAGMKKRPRLKPYYDAMYFDRNKSMAHKIKGYLKSGQDHFVLVGAAHLVGSGSVIELLDKRGFDPVQQ